jgi:hypothetical protein
VRSDAIRSMGATMTVAKSKVLAALRSRGLDDRANWVDRVLPEQIDTARNASLLGLLALDVIDLTDESTSAPSETNEPGPGPGR